MLLAISPAAIGGQLASIIIKVISSCHPLPTPEIWTAHSIMKPGVSSRPTHNTPESTFQWESVS